MICTSYPRCGRYFLMNHVQRLALLLTLKPPFCGGSGSRPTHLPLTNHRPSSDVLLCGDGSKSPLELRQTITVAPLGPPAADSEAASARDCFSRCAIDGELSMIIRIAFCSSVGLRARF